LKFKRYLSCIDTHCSGESTRILVGGVPKLRGKTMAEKQKYFQEHYDGLLGTMLKEPRGFEGMLGAVLTEPTVPEADIGVIYLWTNGYFSACGDSTYSCSAALVNTGMVEVKEPVTEITFDTVAGLVKTKVYVENGVAKSIAMLGVPSFYWKTMKFDVPKLGEVEADIAYGGLWYAFIDADSIGLKPTLENKGEWIPLGWRIRNHIADQVKVDHPEYPEHPRLGDLLHEADQEGVHEQALERLRAEAELQEPRRDMLERPDGGYVWEGAAEARAGGGVRVYNKHSDEGKDSQGGQARKIQGHRA
jgi:proline racemase